MNRIRKIIPRINPASFKQLYISVKEIFLLLWQVDQRLFLVLLFFNIVDGLLILPTLYLDKEFLDLIVKNIANPLWQQSLRALVTLIFARFAVLLMDEFSQRTIGVSNNLLSWKLTARFDLILGEKNTSLDLATVESPEFKDRFDKIMRESGNRSWTLVGAIFELPRGISGIASALIIISTFNPLVTLVLLVLVIPAFFIDAKYARLEYEFRTRKATQDRIWGWMDYYLSRSKSFMEIKIFKLRDYFLKRLSEMETEMFRDRVQLRTGKHSRLFLVNIPQQIFTSAMTFYFGFLVIIGQLTIGTAQAYIRALDTFRSRVIEFFRALLDIYESNLYISDLIWFLHLKPDINGKVGLKFPRQISQGVEFNHVWFRYSPDTPWILKDISFRIEPHENIAIVGENGAGKTTLIKLLSRFFDPQKGEILIDGKPLSKYQRDQYWDHFAVLFQEFESYPFTAREAIGYGNLSKLTDLATIRSFAKKTDIDEFIMNLPQQYENPISREFKGGVTPSFGQLQRIGIARSLIRDSEILVLDEPTSNVDPKAEEDIFNQVLKLGKEKILVFISHRFSTVRRADKILVIESGKITEQGTHQQLIKMNGQYARLFNLQAKSYR